MNWVKETETAETQRAEREREREGGEGNRAKRHEENVEYEREAARAGDNQQKKWKIENFVSMVVFVLACMIFILPCVCVLNRREINTPKILQYYGTVNL